MMDLSKNAINGAGLGATVLILVVGGMFVAKPQFNSATEFKQQQQEVSDSRSTQEIKLAALKSQEGNLPKLQDAMEAAEAQIPNSEDIGSVGRVVVESLDSDVSLMTFAHDPMFVWEPLEQPFVSLEPAPAPFDDITAPPVTGAPVVEPAGPPVLQGVPLTITVQATSIEAVVAYIDRLSAGERLILVNQAQIVGSEAEEGLVNATIYAFAFANAPTADSPTAEAPTSE